MRKIIFISPFLLFILTPVFVFSQEIQYPEIPGEAPPPGPTTEFPAYVIYLFNLAIISGGIIALAVIIWAGFIYLSSATSGEKKAEAKKKIISAFLGLIILLGAYVILATINPQLLILTLQPVTPTAPTTPPSIPTPTTTFQEIPLGTLIENILGKNISCFDKDRNLIDCQESECFATTTGYICKDGVQFQGSATTTFASTYPKIATTSLIFVQDTDFRYCYTYDSDGNKKGLLEYKDQYECIKNLLPALKIKSEKLRDLVDRLEDLTRELKDLASNLSPTDLLALAESLKNNSDTLEGYAENCNCARCSEGLKRTRCGYYECPCDTGCNPCNCDKSNTDPCPNRSDMEDLRNTTIPNLITQITCPAPTCIIPKILAKEKEVHEKRDEIKAFIFGAASSTDFWYYATSMDPYATSTFLTFNEGRKRLKLFLEELKKNLDDLKKAEELMKSPYGDRLTLLEFLDLKEKDPRIVITQKFKKQYVKYGGGYVYVRPSIPYEYGDNPVNVYEKDSEIDKYCWDFNGTSTPPGVVWDKCATSTEGRMCRIKVEAGTSSEQYVFHGDPATFYYHEEYDEEKVLTKEKCTIETKTGESFRLGEIPIGQTVDDAEDFANAVIGQVENFYNEIKSIQDKGVDSINQAYYQIVAVQNEIEKITGRQYETDIAAATTSPHLTLIATTTPHQIFYFEAEDQLKDLTSKGDDPNDDCLDKCSVAADKDVCTSEANKWPGEGGGNEHCWGECCDCDCESNEETHCSCLDVWHHCECETCEGTPCPIEKIRTAYTYIESYYNDAFDYYKKAEGHYKNIVSDHSSINTSISKLPTHSNNFINLIEAKVSPHDISPSLTSSNRCTILHKLINSRRKLQKYFTGYGFALKEGKVKKRIFSSKIGLDLYHGRKLVILPDDFFYSVGVNYIKAYPYNSSKLNSTQQDKCRKNRVSKECWDAINVTFDLLEDYYCCETVP